MSSTEKPREIVVRGVDIGPANRRSRALHARDTHTDAILAVPLPVYRSGAVIEGREAAEHLASLLLAAQGSDKRLSWDRDTPDRTVFTVFSA